MSTLVREPLIKIYYVCHGLLLFSLYWVTVWKGYQPLPRYFGCTETLHDASLCGLHNARCQHRMVQNHESAWETIVCRRECVDWHHKFTGNSSTGTKGYVYGGNGVYAANSAVCAAAIHDGVMTNSGGRMHVQRLPPRDFYDDGGVMNEILAKPMGTFVQSMRFKEASQLESDTFASEAYFSTMTLSLLFLSWVFSPRGRYTCSSKGYVVFVTLNGVAFMDLISQDRDREKCIVACTNNLVLLGMMAFFFHDSFQSVLRDSIRRSLFVLSFCLALRLPLLTSIMPDIDFKFQDPAELALFTVPKVTVLITLIILALALVWRVIRDCANVLGYRMALRAVAHAIIVRGAIVSSFFGIQHLLTRYTVHIHHYFFGLLIATCASVPTISHSITAGIGLGMFVEGSCRWGLEENFDFWAGEPLTTPSLNVTVNGTLVNLVWSEAPDAVWANIYVNDILWVDDVWRPNYTLSGFSNTTNYVHALIFGNNPNVRFTRSTYSRFVIPFV